MNSNQVRNLSFTVLVVLFVGVSARKAMEVGPSQAKPSVPHLVALKPHVDEIKPLVEHVEGNQNLEKAVENSELDPSREIASIDEERAEDHDHSSCMKAIERAMKSRAYDRDLPELSEQEKFDILVSHPKTAALLEHYETYMFDENGEEVLRADLEEEFAAEVAELRAGGGEVEHVILDEL